MHGRMEQANHQDDPAHLRGVLTPTDETAFTELFERHFPAVWRFARRRCASSADADDATAETFAVAWRRRGDAPPPDEVPLWLYGVARRVLANQRRTDERRGRLHRQLLAYAGRSSIAAPADEGFDRRTGLAEALASLSEADRELLLLRSWDGLGATEIATLLGCTPNAASIRLHRARGRLAAALDAVGSPSPLAAPAKEPIAPGHPFDDPPPEEDANR